MSDEERTDLEERAEERYARALAERGVQDVRPLYRRLLQRLRDRDSREYERAAERYREELLPEVAAGESRPVAAWVRYGMWLADRLRPGEAVAVDPSGRSEPVSADSPPTGPVLLLHLPDDWSHRALVLARPADPTIHQEQARELLT